MNTAEALLAVAFPPHQGYRGACTTIADLCRHGLYRGHLGITPDKAAAVHLIVTVGLGSQRSRGKGSRARRRLAGMIGAKMRAVRATPAQVAADASSEFHAEGRIHRNTRPQRHE